MLHLFQISGTNHQELQTYESGDVILTTSRAQLMVHRLRDLQASSPDIEATAIVSIDG